MRLRELLGALRRLIVDPVLPQRGRGCWQAGPAPPRRSAPGATSTYPPSFGSDSTSGSSFSAELETGLQRRAKFRRKAVAWNRRATIRSRVISGVSVDVSLPCRRGFGEAGAFVDRILDSIHEILERFLALCRRRAWWRFPHAPRRAVLPPSRSIPSIFTTCQPFGDWIGPTSPPEWAANAASATCGASQTSELRRGLRPDRDILRREAGGCRGCGKRLPAADPIGDRIGGCLVWRDRLGDDPRLLRRIGRPVGIVIIGDFLVGRLDAGHLLRADPGESAGRAAPAPCSAAGSPRRIPGYQQPWGSARRGTQPSARRRHHPGGLREGSTHRASPCPTGARALTTAGAISSCCRSPLRTIIRTSSSVMRCWLRKVAVGLLAELAVEALRAAGMFAICASIEPLGQGQAEFLGEGFQRLRHRRAR